jgi:hypothetical protein
MAHKGTLNVVILWEEEIREAAKAIAAMEEALQKSESMITPEVLPLINTALARCSVALKGAEDDAVNVLMTRFAPIKKDATKARKTKEPNRV